MSNEKTVADRIKELRIEQGLTQTDLALRIGKKDKSSICKIEGKKNDITLKDVSRVAAALGTTPAYLMGWEQEEQFNAELGELLVAIRKTPMLLKLIQDFILLSDTQKMVVLNVIENFTPEKRAELPLKYWETLIKNEPQYFDKSIRVDFHPKSAAELQQQPCEHPEQGHTDNRECN